jgi:hypothetical protein
MKQLFLISICLLQFSLVAVGQNPISLKETQEIVLSGIDSLVQFNVLRNSTGIKTELDKIYYWYSKKKIHKNRGDYYGKLLHGIYCSFDNESQLISKGTFGRGLKVGQWKEWYNNGNISSVENWKDGLLDGKVQKFNDHGQCVYTGLYQEGEKCGFHIFYSDQGEPMKQTHFKAGLKNGKEIINDNGKELVLIYKRDVLIKKNGKKVSDHNKDKKISILRFHKKGSSRKRENNSERIKGKQKHKKQSNEQSENEADKSKSFWKKVSAIFNFRRSEKVSKNISGNEGDV